MTTINTLSSQKTSFFIVTMLVCMIAFTFPITSHASDGWGADYFGGSEGWDTYSYDSGWDSYAYDSGWDSYAPGYDTWDTYNSGYDSWDTYNAGYDAWDSYAPGYDTWDTYNSGYDSWDTYNPGYESWDSYNAGYDSWDTYNPGYYTSDSYNPGYYTSDSYNPGYYTTDSYNPGYYSSGCGSSCGYTPRPTPCCNSTAPLPPIVVTQPGRPAPTPCCSGGSSVSNVNTNTHVNTTNISNTNIDNSINDSFNTHYEDNSVISFATPQYPIVYQQPIPPVYHPPVYVPPAQPQPYVALTQIPYTGFDFGPLGNAIYWVSLVSFAVAGAYLALYYRGGAFAFARNTLGGRFVRTRAYAPVVAPKAPILIEKEKAAVVAQVEKVDGLVAAMRASRGTTDSMAIVHAKDGSMPKIVIHRA